MPTSYDPIHHVNSLNNLKDARFSSNRIGVRNSKGRKINGQFNFSSVVTMESSEERDSNSEREEDSGKHVANAISQRNDGRRSSSSRGRGEGGSRGREVGDGSDGRRIGLNVSSGSEVIPVESGIPLNPGIPFNNITKYSEKVDKSYIDDESVGEEGKGYINTNNECDINDDEYRLKQFQDEKYTLMNGTDGLQSHEEGNNDNSGDDNGDDDGDEYGDSYDDRDEDVYQYSDNDAANSRVVFRSTSRTTESLRYRYQELTYLLEQATCDESSKYSDDSNTDSNGDGNSREYDDVSDKNHSQGDIDTSLSECNTKDHPCSYAQVMYD